MHYLGMVCTAVVVESYEDKKREKYKRVVVDRESFYSKHGETYSLVQVSVLGSYSFIDHLFR